MKIKTPYGREYKTKQEENEAKIKKRNQTQEWIIGNKFSKGILRHIGITKKQNLL